MTGWLFLMKGARYLLLGDSALTVEFGDEISPEINSRVTAMDHAIRKARIDGVEETVPTYRSLMVRYDPAIIDFRNLVSTIRELETVKSSLGQQANKRIEIPVIYGEEYGPDLEFVADYHNITSESVIELHVSRSYRVYMIGFIAGFPYMGKVPTEIITPRLENPRLKVPAGSVGIAGEQTGIYPREAPGGWRILGRTPMKLFDVNMDPPAMLTPGDIVKFKSIGKDDYARLCAGENRA